MSKKAFQDYYPEHLAHCFGCGRLNEHGHQIKSFWDGDESICHFLPDPKHIAIPGYVYGGMLASLIDCHGTGTAAAAAYRAEQREMDSEPAYRYLTASLHVDYLKPTPLGVILEIRGRVKENKIKKVIIEEWITANGVVTVRGEVVAVQVPDQLIEDLLKNNSPVDWGVFFATKLFVCPSLPEHGLFWLPGAHCCVTMRDWPLEISPS